MSKEGFLFLDKQICKINLDQEVLKYYKSRYMLDYELTQKRIKLYLNPQIKTQKVFFELVSLLANEISSEDNVEKALEISDEKDAFAIEFIFDALLNVSIVDLSHIDWVDLEILKSVSENLNSDYYVKDNIAYLSFLDLDNPSDVFNFLTEEEQSVVSLFFLASHVEKQTSVKSYDADFIVPLSKDMANFMIKNIYDFGNLFDASIENNLLYIQLTYEGDKRDVLIENMQLDCEKTCNIMQEYLKNDDQDLAIDVSSKISKFFNTILQSSISGKLVKKEKVLN